MPEEPIHSIDIPAEGTAGAAFMQARREQDRARREAELLDASANVLTIKNERIKDLERSERELIAAGQRLEEQRNRAVDGLKVYSEALREALERVEGESSPAQVKEEGVKLLKETAERLGIELFPAIETF